MNDFYTVLKHFNPNFPQKFEILCLEIGEKTSVEHDLNILQLAVQYIKHKYPEDVNQILDENDIIKNIDKVEFIKYITESPDGKQTKINSLDQQNSERITQSIYPLVWLDKEVVDEQMLGYLEDVMKKHINKIQIIKEQYDENEKKLSSLEEPKYKIHEKYNYLKALYTGYYQGIVDQILIKVYPDETVRNNISINLITINSSLPYYPKELAHTDLNSASVKRIIGILEKKDQQQLLNLMNIKNLEDIKDGDFI